MYHDNSEPNFDVHFKCILLTSMKKQAGGKLDHTLESIGLIVRRTVKLLIKLLVKMTIGLAVKFTFGLTVELIDQLGTHY